MFKALLEKKMGGANMVKKAGVVRKVDAFGMPLRQSFVKELGKKPDTAKDNLAAKAKEGAMLGLVRYETGMNLLEQVKDLKGEKADAKRILGCFTLIDAAKDLLDKGHWEMALEAVKAFARNINEDYGAFVDMGSMQAKIVAVAGWKLKDEKGAGEEELNTSAEAKEIACGFVKNGSDKELFLKDAKRYRNIADSLF